MQSTAKPLTDRFRLIGYQAMSEKGGTEELQLPSTKHH
uniref:Uncharacterized protein n=1 Tax=Pseudomonas syringae pv. actinidiae TaxID=103796 RepID=M1J6P3_PSESF|nr:hypothetical protein [Pseudomonas syringae pv. actinidiae]AGE82544.1 hypothetical protein [Pseudomonas syringae pv. actinidiae]